MQGRRLNLLLGVLLLSIHCSAAGQWRIVTPEQVPDDGNPAGLAAEVENASGYRLLIQRDIDDTVHGYFELGSSFDVFPDDGCPTFRVDRRAPLDLFHHSRSCIPTGKRVAFTLGHIEDSHIQSEVLLQLMNGNHLLLRYPLKDVGYRETEFTLSGSKQVLGELLGEGIRPTGQ